MLREYQGDCADAVISEWDKGIPSTLANLATGLGKTVIAAELVRRTQPSRAIFLAHRDTLIYQAKNTIQEFTGLKCGIEMADQKADPGIFSKDQVVIGTIQTQNSGVGGAGRMSNFRPTHFDYLIADEAHHFPAPSFKKVVEYYQQNPRLKIVGFTATPDRADEESLGQIFKSTAYIYEILDGIHDGWLVPIDQLMVPVSGLDYSHLSTDKGDLNINELAAVVEEEEIIQRMIQPTLEISSSLPPHRLDYAAVSDWSTVIVKHGKPRRTLVFCVSVLQAQRFAEIMNRVKPGMAAAVWDKVPKTERKKLFEDFSSGALQVLVNVGICSEGFDNPGVEVVVMARGTKSRSLYTQFVGRCIRPLKGIVDGPPTAAERKLAIATSYKPSAVIVDFVGNSGRHKLITCADILGGRVSERAIALTKKKMVDSDKTIRVSDLLDASEEVVRKRIEKAKRDAESRRVKLVARSKFTTVKVDPFNALDITPTVTSNKVVKKLSPNQAALMRRFGVNPDDYGYAQAKQLFVELCKRMKNRMSSPGQCALLKEHGVTNAAELKHAEAKVMIDKLKSNGWKMPSKIDPDL